MNVVRHPKRAIPPEDVLPRCTSDDAVSALRKNRRCWQAVRCNPVGVSGALIEAVTITTRMRSAVRGGV